MKTPQTPTEEQIWDELLSSEASKKFLDDQIRKAEELLNQLDN